MSALEPGQYRIYSTYPDYGGYGFDAYIAFPGGGSGIRPILEPEENYPEQVWTLESAGEPNAFYFVNWAYNTYLVMATSGPSELVSSTEPFTWYIRANGQYNAICYDEACSYSWWASENDLTVVQYGTPAPPNSLWGIVPASSGPSVATYLPPSTGAPSFRTSPTSQAGPVPTPGTLASLQQCAPCGQSKCSFSPSGDPTTGTYSIMFGQPVANCNAGSTQVTTTTVGGTFELSESYSIQTTFGTSLTTSSLGAVVAGVTSSTQYGRETKKTRTEVQETEVSIPPGQIGALVVNMTYTLTPGQMKVDSDFFSFTSNAPGQVQGYSVVYTNCASQFQALTLPMPDCSAGSGSLPSLRFPSRTMLSLVAVLLFVVPWLLAAC